MQLDLADVKIKSTFAALLAIVPILTFVGCSSVDVSKQSGFSSYVGRELPLQSAVALVNNDAKVPNCIYYDGIHSRQVMLDDPAPEWEWLDPIIVQLPVGHLVILDKARVEFRGDLERTVAYGHTTLPNSSNRIDFVYLWGIDFQVQRAPWEPLSVRPVRWLTGERPAHWNYPMFYAPTNQP
jgi:hypothetical protein